MNDLDSILPQGENVQKKENIATPEEIKMEAPLEQLQNETNFAAMNEAEQAAETVDSQEECFNAEPEQYRDAVSAQTVPPAQQPQQAQSQQAYYYQQPSDTAYYNQNRPQENYAYPEEPIKKVKKKGKGTAVFITLACLIVIGAVSLFAVLLLGNSDGNSNSLSDVPELSAVTVADVPEEGLTAAEVYQKVYKSSVSILAYDQASGDLGVLGSGVIFQEDDQKQYTYIVTCAHVISDSDYNLKVELWNGDVYTAEVINYDVNSDIGVIRIKASGLQIAEFADSDEMQPGATVYAIGSPYSSKFAGTFTRGIVSAVNRLVTLTNYQLCCIQHDAAINNGNSGGALLNAYGQVVGINALKINVSNYEGLGFAVPSNTVIKIINSIIETGIAPKAAKLGISYVQAIYHSQFLSDVIEENDYPAGAILVAEIAADSSLYNSELKVNDIIIGVNGEDLNNPDMLVKLIQESSVGDVLELNVIRLHMNEDGTDYTEIETFTVSAALVEFDAAAEQTDELEGKEDFYEYFGDDSGNYEDFYEYFYDYFYGGNAPGGNGEMPGNDENQFVIPD